MTAPAYSRMFAPQHWVRLVAAFSLFTAGSRALGQNDAPANLPDNSTPGTSLEKKALELRLGPFALHPRLAAGLTYDDNLLYSVSNREADTEWTIQPGLQAVAGDDAALIAYRDQRNNVLDLTPGNLIIQRPEDRPGKLFILDYAPQVQIFDKYTANNSLDQNATLDLVWPLDKLILGLRQDYQRQKVAIIEANQRTTVETISTVLSAAYQFGDKTSLESDYRRLSIGYQAPQLTGYTEYNTEDWFNYEVEEGLPVSLGVLAGQDDVASHEDQTYVQLRVRARYIYTEKLVFDASGGGELRQYQNGSPDTLFPVFTVSGSYVPAERTTLILTGSRQQSAAIFNGYNYSTTGATLEVRQGITDRFTANLSGGYYNVDFTRVGDTSMSYTEGYYLARLSLEAKLARHLRGQIFSQLVTAHAQSNGDVNENQAGVQLTLTY